MLFIYQAILLEKQARYSGFYTVKNVSFDLCISSAAVGIDKFSESSIGQSLWVLMSPLNFSKIGFSSGLYFSFGYMYRGTIAATFSTVDSCY